MATSLLARRASLRLALTAVTLLMAASAYGQCTLTIPTSWTGGAGLWNVATNWAPQVIPNDPTTNVCLTNGTAGSPVITQENTFPSVHNLQVGANNTLVINSFRTLTTNGNTIINAGAIDLTSTGQATQLLLNSSATLSGGGTVTLAGSSAAQIFGTDVTLENMDNVIQGQGTIGAGAMVLQNDVNGLINANVISQTLTLSLGGTAAAPGLINYGTLEATSGGTLSISNTVVNNGPDLVGGLITTDGNSHSLILLAGGTTIQGGTLSGNIQVAPTNVAPTLDGLTHGALTNLGTITAPNDTGFNILPGSYINNVGTIALAGAGSLTGINLGSAPVNTTLTTTLAGGSTITMTGGGATSITGGAGLILENLDQTIQGNGVISGAMTFRNDVNGVVNANVAGLGLLLQNTGGVINIGTGVLEATNGGLLQINTTVNNSGATISTDSGKSSAVQLEGLAKIQGGTLNGNVETLGNPTLDGTTHGTLTNQGSFTVQAGNTATLAPGSIINNNGTINVTSNGTGAFLYLGSSTLTTQLTGTGTVTLSSPAATTTAGIYGDGGVTLENVSNTIQGQGQIGVGHNMVFQNDSGGIVNANVSGQSLILNGTGTGVNVINTGLLEATGGGILQIGNVVNNQTGTISTDSGIGSTVLLLQNSDIQGGTLNGNVKTVVNQSAKLDGTAAHGALTNAGTVTVVNGSSLNLVVGSTIKNSGTIAISSTGAPAQLLLGNVSGTTTLTGGGTVVLSDSAHNNAAAIFGNGATLENVNNTIQGEGVLGGFQTTQIFQNDPGGIINANVAGRNLIIDALVNNTGLLTASLGGILQIQNTVNNAGGIIGTDSGFGSVVQLANGLEVVATIQGGTLNGNIQTVAGNAGTLDGITHGALTNLGTITVVNSSTLNLTIGSAILNGGTIALASTGSAAQIDLGTVAGTTTLNGGGIVQLSGSDALIFGGGGATLENVNNKIEGQGQIGAGTNIILKNDSGGTVNANVSDQALILNGTGGVVNAGTLEATGGGILEIKNTINNFGGTVSTDGNIASTVQLYNGANIQGGFLIGNVQTVTGNTTATLNGITHGPLTNLGLVTVVNNSQLEVVAGSTIINSGAIVLAGGGNNTWLSVGSASGATTLTGGGTVTMSNTASAANPILYGTGGVTLNNVNNTIQGEGQIGGGNAMNFTNGTAGTVLANVSGQTLFINPNGTFTNQGTLQVNAGSTLRVESPAILSSNTFSNPTPTLPTGTLLTGTYIVNSGKLEIDGLGNVTAGEIKTIGANASVTLNGANASTSFVDSGGHAALAPLAQVSGSLTITGGYNFASVGTLNNSGSVTIGAGSSITTGAHDYTQNGGITMVNGTLTGTNVTITAGTLAGAGTVNGNATIGAGAILLPGQNGTTPGTLTFDPLTVNGTLQEVLTASGFGITSVTGTLALNSGTSVLDILQAGGYNPAAGTALVIMTAGSPISGSFGAIENQFFNGGSEMWNVVYNPGGLDEVELVAANVSATSVTATSTLSSTGHWTNPASWGCSCVPNNNASNVYAVILNSPGQMLVLDNTDSPTSITVNSVDLKGSTLDLQTGASLTTLGNFTVENGTSLQMTGGTLAVGGMLANQVGGMIVGNGFVTGPGSLTNSGEIFAAHGTLDLSGINITNLSGTTLTGGVWGTAQSSTPGNLILPGEIVTNSAILILDGAGSQITDSTGALLGLKTNSAGQFNVYNGATFTTGGDFSNTNGSSLTLAGGGSMTVAGNLTNDGTSTVQVQNGSTLHAASVSNSGQFLTGNASPGPDTGNNTVNVTGTFTNSAGGVLNLMATGDQVTIGSLVNNFGGTVIVGAGATLNDSLTNSGADTVSGTQNVTGGLTNTATGVITVTGPSGALNLDATGGFSNTGGITINSGGQMNVDASAGFSANTNSGTIKIAGSLNFIDPTYIGVCPGSCNGGAITGGGTINLQGGTLSWATNMYFSTDNAITGFGSITGGTYGVTPFTTTGSITPTGTITINTDLNYDGMATVGNGDALVLNGAAGIAENQTASITVNGGMLKANTFLNVGVAAGATGTLVIQNAGVGTVTGDLTIAGFNATSQGIVTVTGTGSTLMVGGGVTVGGCDGCTGTLNVLAGGVLNSGGAFVGFASGSTGSATVDGAGSQWNLSNGPLSIGNGGTMQVTNSGVVTINGGGAAFTTSGVAGSLSIDGASTVQVQNGGGLSIAGNVDNSGKFLTGNASPGPDAGANTVQVNGTFTNQASGMLNLTGSGDQVTISGGLVNHGSVTVGSGATLNDSLTNSGTDTINGTQNVSGNLANNAPGVVTVNSGGLLTLTVAANTTATNSGTINLTGGTFSLADGGAGAMVTFSGGGTFNLAGGTITSPATDMTFSNADNSITGHGTISNLAVVNQTGGTIAPTGGTLTIGLGLSNAGTVNVTSGNTLAVTGAYSQSAGATTVGGTMTANTYTQTGGSTIIQVGGATTASTFMVNGGNAQVDGGLTAAVTVNAPGTLAGNGTITGDLTNNGTVTPGGSGAPGTLTVSGNYSGTGTLLEQIAGTGAGQFGVLNAGSASLSGTTLDLLAVGGFTAVAGDTFDILNATLGGTPFGAVDVSGLDLASGLFLDIAYNSNDVELCVSTSSTSCTTGGGGPPPPPVPEPGSIFLFATAVAAIGWQIRRKRRTAGSRQSSFSPERAPARP